MSDTPRTEEAHRIIVADHDDPVERYRYCLDLARQLERELASAVARVQHAEGLLECAADMDAAKNAAPRGVEKVETTAARVAPAAAAHASETNGADKT